MSDAQQIKTCCVQNLAGIQDALDLKTKVKKEPEDRNAISEMFMKKDGVNIREELEHLTIKCSMCGITWTYEKGIIDRWTSDAEVV